jgi:cellulase/cellobiase CelA1
MLMGDPFMDLLPVTPQSSVSASVNVTSSWVANGQTSYCANVVLSNAGPATITTWAIGLNTNQSAIYNSWSANFGGSAPSYTLTPLSYNGTVPPANNLTFSFCANATGAQWTPSITSATGR